MGGRWRFYCWRCQQWCETAGPWCDLYASEPLTEECYFREHPERADGVPWSAEVTECDKPVTCD